MDSSETSPQVEVPHDTMPIIHPAMGDSHKDAAQNPAPMDGDQALADSSPMYPDDAYLESFVGCSGKAASQPVDVTLATQNNDREDEKHSDLVPTIDSAEDSFVWTKGPKSPPKEIRPFLESFTLFPKLAVEIRDIIWRLTLTPRTVEISYNLNHGFYSRVKTPIALRACPDSRRAVIGSYPLRFGSNLHRPSIVFNFSLDTLYFDWGNNRVCQFLVSLSDVELKGIQSIAVHEMSNEAIDFEYAPEDDSLDLFKKASHVMPALKEFLIVYDLGMDWHGHGFPEGSGPIELFPDFTYELQQYMYREGIHLDDEDGESECQEPPNSEHLTEGFDVPETRSVFGWRPTKLPMNTPPWWE